MNWRRIGRIALRIGAGIAALAVFLLVVSIVIVQTAWFQNFVREKIVSVTEESTGGRVEIGSLNSACGDWRLTCAISFCMARKRQANLRCFARRRSICD